MGNFWDTGKIQYLDQISKNQSRWALHYIVPLPSLSGSLSLRECVYSHVRTSGHRVQKQELEPLDGNWPAWVLGIKPWSYARAASALTHGAMSPAVVYHIIQTGWMPRAGRSSLRCFVSACLWLLADNLPVLCCVSYWVVCAPPFPVSGWFPQIPFYCPPWVSS